MVDVEEQRALHRELQGRVVLLVRVGARDRFAGVAEQVEELASGVAQVGVGPDDLAGWPETSQLNYSGFAPSSSMRAAYSSAVSRTLC